MFLQAARHAEVDNMRGVSANVMCGQEGYYGTSSFSILLDMKKMATVKPKEKTEVQEIVFGKQACDTIQIHNNLGSIAETTKDKDVEYTIQLF